jgi:hypothetical protein
MHDARRDTEPVLWNLHYIIFILISIYKQSMILLRTEVFTAVLRMASSEMIRRVALVRTDLSEEISASIIRVTRSGELGTTLAVKNGVF